MQAKTQNSFAVGVWKISIILGTVILVGIIILFMRQSFRGGPSTSKIRELEWYLKEEPCDRRRILEFQNELFKEGHYRRLLKESDRFLTNCGDYPRLLWSVYESHKALSEFDKAIEVATQLIDADPYDKDYRAWRGLVYEQVGEWEKAAMDYQQTIQLVPNMGNIPFNLATIYEKLGRPCEGLFPIEQFLYYYPDERQTSKIKVRINQLTQQGKCNALSGRGSAVIPLQGGGGAILSEVRVNQKATGMFLIDTGASYVTLSTEFARKSGISSDDGRKILVQTAGGPQEGVLTTVNWVELKGLKAPRVDIVVLESLPKHIDGLLGLSFLTKYDFRMDSKEGKVILSEKQ